MARRSSRGYSQARHLDLSWSRPDPSRRALAAALAIFANEIGARIVAEGIETAQELSALLAIGAHDGQGYLLGRPADLHP